MSNNINTTTARYYDHAKNQRIAAVGHAIAKAAREVKAEGTAWTVEFVGDDGVTNFWSGTGYDCLALAKDLTRNGYEARLTSPWGLTKTAAEILDARY